MSIESLLLRLHPADDVAVARVAITAGQALGDGLTAREAVPAGHKLALRGIALGEDVRKYGQVIGQATRDIAAGEHVHVHNLDVGPLLLAHADGRDYRATLPAATAAHFDGYVRHDGRVGTRNYVLVLSSVNCSATVCKAIERHYGGPLLAAWPGVDGVVAVTHGTGCGMAGTGEGIEILRRTLRGYAVHPNVGGVLVIGLGCEVNQVQELVQDLPLPPERLRVLGIQDAGGTREAIQQGIHQVAALLAVATQDVRTPVAARHLLVGLQCGGSDGYSGITANPALGAAVDLLVQQGGTAMLSETPEIYGAEHLLTARAASPHVAERLRERIRWWEAYTAQHGGDMNNNPSPGNKAGGITTILEKSLGAVAKGGQTGLMEVLAYAQQPSQHGLVFMDTPGYDPVSATGQVAGGANLICFTTGRGSTYGCKPTPSLKIATHTAIFQRMSLDMDFNAGGIVDGDCSVAEAGQKLFELMLATASGRATLSETNDLGHNEFVPWQLGAVM